MATTRRSESVLATNLIDLRDSSWANGRRGNRENGNNHPWCPIACKELKSTSDPSCTKT